MFCPARTRLLLVIPITLLLASCSYFPDYFGTRSLVGPESIVLAACDGNLGTVDSLASQETRARAFYLMALAREKAEQPGSAAAYYDKAAATGSDRQIVIACPNTKIVVGKISQLAAEGALRNGKTRMPQAGTQPMPPKAAPKKPKSAAVVPPSEPSIAPPPAPKAQPVKPKPTPAPPQTKTVAKAPPPSVWVQIASYRIPENADKGWKILTRRHPNLLEKATKEIRQAQVRGKLYHRLGVGDISPKDAQKLCKSLKAAGQYCLVFKR